MLYVIHIVGVGDFVFRRRRGWRFSGVERYVSCAGGGSRINAVIIVIVWRCRILLTRQRGCQTEWSRSAFGVAWLVVFSGWRLM